MPPLPPLRHRPANVPRPAASPAPGPAAPASRDPVSTASIGLVTLNARYVHLALSLRYLRNAARDGGFPHTWLAEYTVQTPAWKIAAELTARRPAVLGFSVYIWNRRETLALIELLKKGDPGLYVVVGGPEVSFEAGPPSPHVDAVIAGEGELKWVECLRLRARGETPDAATRARWAAYGTELPPLAALPYREEDLAGLAERLVYLETSRGCPFTCAFCLSALDERVRFFPAPAVRETIERLVAAGARRIKFLDRTFNLGKARVRELLRWLFRFRGVEFHFEVVGDLLDDALLELLEEAPPGMFQFEVGVQSALPQTQVRIDRRQDGERLFSVLARLRAAGRVHLHADLIWGLPGETLADIRVSFERVVALAPHELQLGFLKFLPGAPIRRLIDRHGYVYQEQPPYEVIAHRELSAAELLDLKRFEAVFDPYYNSGRFRFTLARLCADRGAWEVFATLAGHFARHELLVPAHGLEALSRHLLDAARGWLPVGELEDLLKLDYFYHHRARRVPPFLNGGEARETPAVRDWRRHHPNGAVAAFRHRIALGEGAGALTPALTPAPAPVWYAFTYPEGPAGYLFRAELHPLE